jgi:xanthosine utilization system XapX-like protein
VERRASDESVTFAEQSEAVVAWRELSRIEIVLRTSYMRPLATFTALIAVGVVVALLSNQAPTRKGVALAFMIVGVLGHTLEARSIERNQAYLGQVRASIASLPDPSL